MRRQEGPPGVPTATGGNRSAQQSIALSDPLQELVSRLSSVKKTGSGWTARCPAHDDRNPSLSVSVGDDGRVLLHCHAGCTPDAIVSAVGLTLADLYPPSISATASAPSRNRKPRHTYGSSDEAIGGLLRAPELHGGEVTRYAYHRANGSLAFVVLRFDFADDREKTFRPIHPIGDGWAIGDPPGKIPLYRLPELDGAECVYVCEGEKGVDAAQTIGLCVTTSAHGSGSAQNTDWTPLAGKAVVIFCDNDAPGRKYANTVARILVGLGCKVKIVDLAARFTLPDGGDIADWIDAHDSRESDDLRRMIEAIVEKTPSWQPAEAADAPVPLRWQPFPVHVLPEPVRAFITEGARAIGCDASMIALPALAAIASVIGTTRRIRLKRTWCEPAVLWTAIVGHSGTLKSPAQEYALRSLKRLQVDGFRKHAEAMQQYEQDKMLYERNLIQWKRSKGDDGPPEKPDEPRADRLVCADATIEALAPILENDPGGVLLARDELVGWLKSFDCYRAGKGGDSATWLELHRAGPLTIDRKTGKRVTHVASAAVSICGTIQPGTLRRSLGREHFENGLAARLLLAMPPRQLKRWTDADVAQRTVDAFAAMLEKLRRLRHEVDENGEPVPVDVPLSDDGRRAWVAFFDEHARRQHDTHDGDLAAAFSKLEGYAARFALVFHFVKGAAIPSDDRDAIGPESIEAGAELVRWFCVETERLYGMFSETDDDRVQRELVESIRLRGGSVTVNELRHGPRQFRGSVEAAREALQVLVDSGAGRWEHRVGPKGGRPAERFALFGQGCPDGTGTETPAGTPKNAGLGSSTNSATHYAGKDGKL